MPLHVMGQRDKFMMEGMRAVLCCEGHLGQRDKFMMEGMRAVLSCEGHLGLQR